jgi:Tfp pilus assembly protein PilX
MSRTILRSGRQRGSILIVALLVMVLLSLLGITLLTVAETEHNVAANAVWSEGALLAAEASLNTSLSQLSANAETSSTPVPLTTIAASYTFRSGPRTTVPADTPQAAEFVGKRTEVGYSLAVGTGYNAAGYSFNMYRMTATGRGPRNAVREVQVQAEYGPVAQ